MFSKIRVARSAAVSLRWLVEAQHISRMFEEDKRRYLSDIACQRQLRTFIETGTYLGKTAKLLSDVCQQVVTVEVEPTLYARAAETFKDVPHVKVLFGDSGELMPEIIADLTEPALFWLDGHYSGGITGGKGDAPIIAELRAVLSHPITDHVIVIDDARAFTGRDGYPRLTSIINLVCGSPYRIALNSDLIRIQREDI